MKRSQDIATIWPSGSGTATARAWLGAAWTPQIVTGARSETLDRVNSSAAKDRAAATGTGWAGGGIFGVSERADAMLARGYK